MRRVHGWIGVALGMAICISHAAALAHTPPSASPPDPAAHAALHELFEQHHHWTNTISPEDALRRGEPTQADRLDDRSLEAIRRHAADNARFLEQLMAIDPATLDAVDREHHALFERHLREARESHERLGWLMAVGPIHGPQQSLPQLHERVPFGRMQDFRDYLSRLRAVPPRLEQETAILREGMRVGMVPPRVTVEMLPAQCDAILRGELQMLLEPLVRLPAEADPAEAESLRKDAARAVTEALAALGRFRDFLRNDYIPACRDTIAASDLPDGAAYYAWCLKHHTTTELTADEIHAMGLSEVARLRGEMLAVIARTEWFTSTEGVAAKALGDEALFAAFIAHLRTDARFYHASADALLDGYRAICKRVDGMLPTLFRTLPRLPYGVREIPRFMAPSQTTAYYQPGSLDGGTAGFFCANTYALDQRPIYEMIPLALHEAVPGHHLQIALAQELPEQPFFRREGYITAFGEGWALYAERLGIEMGLYTDPYDDFGRLLYEMWRSCRLVVDTGMHAKGWSRAQAIEFMRANTALSTLNIEREVDRYIAWPGQACAYKIGELRIRAMRSRAEERLGANFDLRAFHEVILGGGAVPLGLLEERVNAWIDRVASANASG